MLRGLGFICTREHTYSSMYVQPIDYSVDMRRILSKYTKLRLKYDTRAIGAAEEDVHVRTGWRRIVSAAATPQQRGNSYGKKTNIFKTACLCEKYEFIYYLYYYYY